MCGIFGTIISDNAACTPGTLKSIINQQFRLSEPRGKEAAGLAVNRHNTISVFKQSLSASVMIRKRDYIYFTDTGRSWDSSNNRRDRIESDREIDKSKLNIKTTADLIRFLNTCQQNIIISSHPERWAERLDEWAMCYAKDLVVNFAKKILR